MADFNIDDLIAEATASEDTTATVQVAEGSVSEAKSKSGLAA